MSTTAQAIAAVLEELEPSAWQRTTLIPARKKSVLENLTSTFPSNCDMPFWRADLIGSAAKDTIIRPIDDVDVLAVFSDVNNAWAKYRYDSRKFLYRVRNAYDGVDARQVGARGQAVRVFFQTGGHVDVVPVFFAGDNDYLLPAGDGSWMRTSPFVANDWFQQRNRDLGYQLRPLVRLLKQWNRAHSHRMKSYHLETVAASLFASLGPNQRMNMRDFFAWAPNWLTVADPGGHSSDLSSYLTWDVRQEVKQSLKAAADRADRAVTAESAGNHVEAQRLWAIVLGTTVA